MGGAPDVKRFTIITGHYGSGKTNLSINLAIDLAVRYSQVTLVDLDIVNPYFRSSDYTSMLAKRGIDVIAPRFAGTTLDVPALSPAVYSAFEKAGAVIFDVGGDDAGATALGRFSNDIQAIDYDLLYVVNRYRNLTTTPNEAAGLLGEIEHAAHLKATGIINNSHLQHETTLATVVDSAGYATEVARLLQLPLVATTVPAALEGALSREPGTPGYVEKAYPVQVYVRTPWDEGPVDVEEGS